MSTPATAIVVAGRAGLSVRREAPVSDPARETGRNTTQPHFPSLPPEA